MKGWFALILLPLMGVVCSCQKGNPPPVAPVTRTNATEVPAGEPQPRLQTLDLYIGTNVLKTELALTGPQQQKGMMYRKGIGEDEAMLFVFKAPGQLGFYMRNTLIPLSLAYIDAEGQILEIKDLEPLNTNTVFSSSQQVQYALETARGWFERHQVKPGMVVGSSRGPLPRVFFGQRP